MQSFWLGPVFLGAVLILVGILLYRYPELLAYVVAAAFVFAGISLIGVGWRMRGSVHYRRIDQHWEGPDER